MSDPNRYRSRAEQDGEGWRVVIVDPSGAEVFHRAFPEEAVARGFASTVDQHIGWLSEAKFRRYYRISEHEER